MQIIWITQYATMMVLHKSTLEDLFLRLLEITVPFYQDRKVPSLHRYLSHKYRAQSEAADKDGDSYSEIPEAPLFPVSEHVRNLGQVT